MPTGARRGFSSASTFRVILAITVLLGMGAAAAAFSRTDGDPISLIITSWQPLLGAAGLYLVGMAFYAASWASLFDRGEDRALLSLTFLVSQPVKYLPGGFAQPLSQVALAATASRSRRSGIVAFPVHVFINVVAAITLAAPGLFLNALPAWAPWGALGLPLLWALLDRRWMLWLLGRLGRLSRVFSVSDELPGQGRIARAFALALPGHALMFSSFGVIAGASVPGESVFVMTVLYGIAWTAGYLVIPAPAGLGAREAALIALLAWTAPAVAVIQMSVIHRVATLSTELLLMVSALAVTSARRRRASDPSPQEGSSSS